MDVSVFIQFRLHTLGSSSDAECFDCASFSPTVPPPKSKSTT